MRVNLVHCLSVCLSVSPSVCPQSAHQSGKQTDGQAVQPPSHAQPLLSFKMPPRLAEVTDVCMYVCMCVHEYMCVDTA